MGVPLIHIFTQFLSSKSSSLLELNKWGIRRVYEKNVNILNQFRKCLKAGVFWKDASWKDTEVGSTGRCHFTTMAK
jgi:hypothetical protein